MWTPPSWLIGAAGSLAVVLLANLIQSSVSGWREARRRKRDWYERTARLSQDVVSAYEVRRHVHEQRDEESQGEGFTSGPKGVARDNTIAKITELNEHINEGVVDDPEFETLKDELEEASIWLYWNDDLESEMESVIELCGRVENHADTKRDEYDSILI